jgi:hypothetical protein
MDPEIEYHSRLCNRVNQFWILELNFRNLDLTLKMTDNDSVRSHEVSVFVCYHTGSGRWML